MIDPPESHEHPTLYVSRTEYDILVLDNHFEISIQELQDQIQVLFVGIYSEQLSISQIAPIA